MDDIRKQRIENLMKEKISQMIVRGDIKDPRVNTMVTVSRVDISRDLSIAKVYISSLFEGDSLKKVVQGFKSASGFIRTELARKMDLRHMPELRFIEDESVAESFHMVKTLESLVPQEEKEDE